MLGTPGPGEVDRLQHAVHELTARPRVEPLAGRTENVVRAAYWLAARLRGVPRAGVSVPAIIPSSLSPSSRRQAANCVAPKPPPVAGAK